MQVNLLSDQSLAGQRVLIREDLNVPIDATGRVADDTRIRASLPTIRAAAGAGARVMLMSHLGRPTEGVFEQQYSLSPVAERLSELLTCSVPLISDWLSGADVAPGQVVLFENVRFNVGEKSNDPDLARRMAALCDLFVMDAFGTAHRAQASTHGVAEFAPLACAGPLLEGELEALTRALDNPARPMIAIVGGSKVSSKLSVLESLCDLVDSLVVGGGIANTFIAAAGFPVGKSIVEPDMVDTAANLAAKMRARGRVIPIPTDVVVATEFSETATATVRSVAEVRDDEMILDIGPQSAKLLGTTLAQAGTILWNGPVGVFEFDSFSAGTRAVAAAIAESSAFSIAGGGDTLAAIASYKVADNVSYISTGGGAFLEFLEGRKLPAVEILERRYTEHT